jgi:hypothetical protein
MFYGLGRRLRIGIVPGRIGVLLAIYEHRVIACATLPRAVRTRRTGFQKSAIYSLFRKVNAAFNRFDFLALRESLSVPNCLSHIRLPIVSIRCSRQAPPASLQIGNSCAAVKPRTLYGYSINILEMEVSTKTPTKLHRIRRIGSRRKSSLRRQGFEEMRLEF